MSELAYENCYGVINNHIIGKSTVDNRNLALVYDPDSVYNKDDHCIHGMKYWVCNTNNTTGTWNATKWTQTRVGDETARDISQYFTMNGASDVTKQGVLYFAYYYPNTNIVECQIMFGTNNLNTFSDIQVGTLTRYIPTLGTAGGTHMGVAGGNLNDQCRILPTTGNIVFRNSIGSRSGNQTVAYFRYKVS